MFSIEILVSHCALFLHSTQLYTDCKICVKFHEKFKFYWHKYWFFLTFKRFIKTRVMREDLLYAYSPHYHKYLVSPTKTEPF